MNRYVRPLLFLVLAVLLAGAAGLTSDVLHRGSDQPRTSVAPDRAQGSTAGTLDDPRAARVDRFMSLFDREDAPGGVIAVVEEGELVFARGYGMANLEYSIPNTPETVFHVASVSKQFSAFAIVLLAQQGALSLDDEVSMHLPEMPDFGESVTLRHLIHHTSGLRDQWTLWAMSGGRMDDVITQDNLLSLIYRQRELNFSPGTAHVYSNSGYTLLAEVVEHVTGVPFRAWMKEHVFDPLGMEHTQVYDNHERIVEGRAYSYRYGRGDQFRKAVLSYANTGATSLFTTAEDLARWMANLRDGTVGGMDAIEQLQERAVLAHGDTLSYAFGINIDTHNGLKRLQHSGADAGYRSFLSYYPEIDGGVVLLSNLASFNPRFAEYVAEIFFEEAMTQGGEHDPAGGSFRPRFFNDFEGSYGLENEASDVVFFRTTNRFYMHVADGPVQEIYPASDVTFTNADGTEAVTFTRNSDGGVEYALLSDGRALRKEPQRELTADALEDYEGTYFSPELQTFYTLVVEGDRLVATHRRHAAIHLRPRIADLFDGDSWFFNDIRFLRDEDGEVTAMRVSSDRVHHLLFERL